MPSCKCLNGSPCVAAYLFNLPFLFLYPLLRLEYHLVCLERVKPSTKVVNPFYGATLRDKFVTVVAHPIFIVKGERE